jgi:hypothetical protein
MEVEALERAPREPGEDEVLRCPIGLGVRRVAEALDDGVFETSGRYSGQRVITTFFSV